MVNAQALKLKSSSRIDKNSTLAEDHRWKEVGVGLGTASSVEHPSATFLK